MIDLSTLDRWRVCIPHPLWDGDATCGAFVILSSIDGGALRVIASCGYGWDHVSVSRQNRCPNWHEMSQIARMFFRADETAMQLHVPESEHVNYHPYTLHWWRPQDAVIPKPPAALVGAPTEFTLPEKE